MNTAETKRLFEQERKFLDHQNSAPKHRIGLAPLMKRIGHLGEATNKLRSDLTELETRAANIVLMLEVVPDVEHYLADHYYRKHDVPVTNSMDHPRAGFLGIFQFVSDAMFAHRFGSPAIAQLAGPAASQVNELIEATGKAAEGNARPLAREVANAVPIVNVIPAARRGITEVIAPESRRDRRERR